VLIDTHCHLHDREFFSTEEAEKMLARAHENGIEKIVCIGTSHEDSLAARDFAEAHDNVYWTYGIHPEYASEVNFSRSASARPVATGERRSCSSCQAPQALRRGILVRLRHRAPLIPAILEGDTLYFENEIKRPASGQSAVLYDGEICIGGGIIC